MDFVCAVDCLRQLRWISFALLTAFVSSGRFCLRRRLPSSASMDFVRPIARTQRRKRISFALLRRRSGSDGFRSAHCADAAAPTDSVQPIARTQRFFSFTPPPLLSPERSVLRKQAGTCLEITSPLPCRINGTAPLTFRLENLAMSRNFRQSWKDLFITNYQDDILFLDIFTTVHGLSPIRNEIRPNRRAQSAAQMDRECCALSMADLRKIQSKSQGSEERNSDFLSVTFCFSEEWGRFSYRTISHAMYIIPIT